MLEFTRVSRWFRVANGYTLRYSQANKSWRVCAPGGKLLGTVGEVAEGERLANQHAEDEAAAEAATQPWEPPGEIEVRGYSADDIEQEAERQGIEVGAAMLSLAMGAPYEELSTPPGYEPGTYYPGEETSLAIGTIGKVDGEADGGPLPPEFAESGEFIVGPVPQAEYLTERHGSARMVTETNDDTGDVTMKPCQCLSPNGDLDGGAIVVSPCGGEVPNKRDFKPGHDAKLKSTMIKAHRAGGTLVILDGGTRTETTAKAIATQRGWERFLTDAPARKPRKGAKADTAEAPAVEEPVGASQPAQVKVRGAWKDGFVTKIEGGDNASSPQQVTVTYTNAKRKQVTITLPSDSDKLKMG